MKKVYIKPNVIVVKTCMESLLVGDSGDGQLYDPHAKRNNHFSFSSWDDEEEETPTFPRSKSVWDD